LMALVSGYQRFASEQFWVTQSVLAKIFVSLLACAGLIYLGPHGWRKFQEYAWLHRAEKAKNNPSEKLAALQKAAEIEPKNADTVYTVGEIFRLRSWLGEDDYEKWANEALPWFERGFKLNPRNPYNYISYGMCLDWIGRHDEAAPYFERATALDPNSYYTALHHGWHFVQLRDYPQAEPWMVRAVNLGWVKSAWEYWVLVEQKLAEEKKVK
ncbi:MAG: tetratricopeptide repeat protein, partial [Limisphaerales bacterium]